MSPVIEPLPKEVKLRLDHEIWIQNWGTCPACQRAGGIRKDNGCWSCYFCATELFIKVDENASLQVVVEEVNIIDTKAGS